MRYKQTLRKPTEGEVQRYLSYHVRKLNELASGELKISPSPCCGYAKTETPALSINKKTGFWRCYRCAKEGGWYQITQLFGDPLAQPYTERIKPMDVSKFLAQFQKENPRSPITSGKYPKLLEYCNSIRGIENETLDAWRVVSQGPTAMRWPLHTLTENGWEITNFKVRACLDPDESKKQWFGAVGSDTRLLIGNHLLDPAEKPRAIITEGEFDAMIGYQIGLRNIFSLPNGASSIDVSNMLRYIPDHWEIWLAMDMDSSGDKAVEKFFAQLGTDRVARIIMPYKDLNDWYLASNKTLMPNDVEQCAKGLTTMVSMAGINGSNSGMIDCGMNSFQISADDMFDSDDETQAVLAPTPWPSLTKALGGGFLSSETTGILAPSGGGKSTIVNQIALKACSFGCTVGLISLEGARHVLRSKLKDALKGMVKPNEYQQTLERLFVSQLEQKRIKFNDIITQVELYLCQGAKLIIVDNLDYISGVGPTANQDKADCYGDIVELCRERSAHAIMIWQPRSVDVNTTINSGHQKGFSSVLQDSSNYINVNEVQGLPEHRRFHVEKARESGHKPVFWTIYDPKSRTTTECLDPRNQDIDSGKILDFKPR